jgi:hypothetical protein
MDIYTKSVLTIIAAALSVIACRNLAESARADTSASPLKVVLCNKSGDLCAEPYTMAGTQQVVLPSGISTTAPLPVQVTNVPLPALVTNVPLPIVIRGPL